MLPAVIGLLELLAARGVTAAGTRLVAARAAAGAARFAGGARGVRFGVRSAAGDVLEAKGLTQSSVSLPITSGAIDEATYDIETGILTIVFRDGTSQDYAVDPEMASALVIAPSPGAFFNAVIRGRYEV